MKNLSLLLVVASCVLCRSGPAAPIEKPSAPYVIACGRDKLALYWYKVKGAKAYYVYRRTKSTRFNFKAPTAKLRFVPDSFAGSPMKLWVDRKLVTGREYFYAIKAMDAKGRLSAVSAENSDVVDPSAVPWDSCDPKKIVDALTKHMNASMPDKELVDEVRPTDEFVAMGPDGMTYSKHKGVYSKAKAESNPDIAPPTA